MKVAFFGLRGWIGPMVRRELEAQGHEVIEPVPVDLRADDAGGVGCFLDASRPTHLFSTIGRTHGPGHSTIDYLEQPGKLVENVRDNLYAPIMLALACKARGIHYTYVGTGCVFSSVRGSADVADVAQSQGYDEAAEPDFFGSSYSVVKGFTDRMFHLPGLRDHVLNLRIRMPITSEVSPRNFITKICAYAAHPGVCSVPNSMSVLHTLWPGVVRLMERGEVGTLNLTNPGVISHDEILAMVREIVDPTFEWKALTLEDQDKVLACKRSNNKLRTDKLQALFPEVPHIHDAVRACLQDMAKGGNYTGIPTGV
jgi:dTDP-4-dehydrorhamnose reductase